LNARITMADIGRLAGVSTSTVSRALRGHPAIPASTRERILQIAAEQHYVIDTRAQNFRLQRSQTIATVFPYVGPSRRMISDPFYMEMIGAITDALDQHGYDLIVSRVAEDHDNWSLNYIQNKRVDGLLVIDRALDDHNLARLADLDAHVVVWGSEIPGQRYVTVGGDSERGGILAAQHLAGLGRRRVGFIGGSPHMVETSERLRGYRQGLMLAGLAYDAGLVTFTDFSPQAGAQAIDQLLTRAPDLDGVFLCSDVMAMAAIQVLAARDRRVPDDLSIVGYDDIQLAAHASPPLTTIRQQIHTGGQLMVDKLLRLIDGGREASHTLSVELVVRGSCGARRG
jgi:DNA-binding LacI/PurR family transcriptional regulator